MVLSYYLYTCSFYRRLALVIAEKKEKIIWQFFLFSEAGSEMARLFCGFQLPAIHLKNIDFT